jgi:hypothetical protein
MSNSTVINRRTVSVGPNYPTVSWRKGSRDSKIHYQGDHNKTICGKRIPRYGVGEADPSDMCERCLKIIEHFKR